MTQFSSSNVKTLAFNDKEKPSQVRDSNITSAKALADALKSSFGSKGMDKMIEKSDKNVLVTNDGATILKNIALLHPISKMLVELSAAQDVEAGDGTTTVVILVGSLLSKAEELLKKGIHPTTISTAFSQASKMAVQVLEANSVAIDISNREALIQSAVTSLNSKVVSQYSSQIAPLAVSAVLKVIDPKTATNVDLKDIKVVSKVGGTIDDMELVDGLVLTQSVCKNSNGPSRMEKAKIALVQFQLSAPKTDMENQIIVSDYRQMDKILKEEREYILNICKKIKKSGANVLLIQKSILRDAVNELALHFLAKLKILVISEIEREEVEFICRTTGAIPIADIQSFTEERLGAAELVEEVNQDGARFVKILGLKNPHKTVSIVCRGSNQVTLEEAERSLHDALCVVRCLVKKKAIVGGGGCCEMQVSQALSKHAKTLKGIQSHCFEGFAEALKIIPTVLAKNSGLDPISIVTELANKHASGDKTAGINIRKGVVSNIFEENVIQPLLVSTSAIKLVTETVSMILKIDDIILVR